MNENPDSGFGTESDAVQSQYRAWPYPQPVPDMAKAVERGYFDRGDPSLFRRKLWPKRIEPADLDILVAGCGTNQAAYYAFKNPNCRVVGIDVSETSLSHQNYLKEKHGLRNLELHQLSLGQVASLNQNFDLVVSTGVLMILPDPDAGLRCLRDVLRPHGVMTVMVYGYYARVGVYMLQDLFRLLGLQQDMADIETVRHALEVLPEGHFLRSYMERLAPDLDSDSGIVDTFLIRQDRAYTVPQVLQLAHDNGLKFQSWLDNVYYSTSAVISRPEDPLRKHVEALPLPVQWQLIEILAQQLASHRFLLCHPDRAAAEFVLDFTGQAWLDYIPSLRPPARVAVGQRFRGRSSQEEPWATSITFQRAAQRLQVGNFESMLLALVNGQTPIREIIQAEPLLAWDEATRTELAHEFFRCMADWDNLLFEIP